MLKNTCYKKILSYIKLCRLKHDIHADMDFNGLKIKSSSLKILNLNDVRSGDILFCRRRRNVPEKSISNVIESFTGGYYTHCAIYIGNSEIIHATSPIVVKDSIQKLLDDYLYIVICRINSIEPEKVERMNNFALEMQGCKYNALGAILSPFKEYRYIIKPNLGKTNIFRKVMCKPKIPKKFFCSQLVLESLRNSGILSDDELFMHYWQSSNWTPTGFAKYGYGNTFCLIGYLVNDKQELDGNDFFMSNSVRKKFEKIY